VAAGTEAGFSPCRLHPPWFASASAGMGFRACIGVCLGWVLVLVGCILLGLLLPWLGWVLGPV